MDKASYRVASLLLKSQSVDWLSGCLRVMLVSLYLAFLSIVDLPIKTISRPNSQTSYGNDLSVLRLSAFMQAEQLTPFTHVKDMDKDIGDWESFMMVLHGYFNRVRSTKPCSDGT